MCVCVCVYIYIYIYIYMGRKFTKVYCFLYIYICLVGRSRDRSPVVSLGIFSVVSSDKTVCPEVDSASENEYQGFLLG